MTAPTIYRRTTIDGEATLSGLLDIVAKISQVAPQSAEIVEVQPFFEHQYDENGVCDETQEPEMRLAFTVQWDPKEEES
jgi:hypothetical protein